MEGFHCIQNLICGSLSSSVIIIEAVEGSVGAVPSRFSRMAENTSSVSNESSFMIGMGAHIWEGPPGAKISGVRVEE